MPTWLNEDLAMQLAGSLWSGLDQTMDGALRIIPLESLEESWMRLHQDVVSLA